MTRHDMILTSAAGYRPPATGLRTPMVIIEGEKAAPGPSSCRQYRAKAQRSGLSVSMRTLPHHNRAVADIGRKSKSP